MKHQKLFVTLQMTFIIKWLNVLHESFFYYRIQEWLDGWLVGGVYQKNLYYL
jgi:hypothetical protein